MQERLLAKFLAVDHFRQRRRRQNHNQCQHRLWSCKAGKNTVVIDFDVGLRNLDLIMGCERRVVYDFVNVVNERLTLKQALIKDKRFDNLSVLAAFRKPKIRTRSRKRASSVWSTNAAPV